MWVFFVHAARSCRPRGPPLSFWSSLQITARHSAATRLPKLEIGKRLGTLPFGPFLDEGCEFPERIAGLEASQPLLDWQYQTCTLGPPSTARIYDVPDHRAEILSTAADNRIA